jgi:hypothetical protein
MILVALPPIFDQNSNIGLLFVWYRSCSVFIIIKEFLEMSTLKFDPLFSAETDWELNQYKVLGGIKLYLDEFRKKKIYPALDDLLKLNTLLENLLNQNTTLSESFEEEIEELDLNNKELFIDSFEKNIPDQQFFIELVQWSLPHIKEAIEEGIVLYDFVERNIKLIQLGVLPSSKDEGYFVIPDNVEQLIQVHRFKCPTHSSKGAKSGVMNTRYLQSVDKSLLNTPESINRYLINTYSDYSNHATFICQTDLDFPFKESLFPVAKRKLIDFLAK